MSATPNTNIAFIVEVTQVTEVALVADADLTFWQERLKEESLFPCNRNGRAELIISATALRWMGTRTNEFTVGISVSQRQEAIAQDGLYLVHAFHSSRLFAFIERTMFHTPYVPGRILVEDRVPAKIQLGDAHGMIFSAAMTEATAPASSRDELWQGPIFLPRNKKVPQQPGMFFVAKLGGDTQTYSYAPASDVLRIVPRAAHPVFQWLLESGVAGKEWRIRNNAVHARSKTFRRV